MPDGTSRSIFTRIKLGTVGEISDLSARREHDRLRQQINRERGFVPTAPKGETFAEVAKTYMTDIGPQLSISTHTSFRASDQWRLWPSRSQHCNDL
jgi:hypothetical protein